ADISNLVTWRVGPNLWSRGPVEPAMKGINHQWSSGSCSKECTAWIQMQAASDNYEQKHKQTENQRVVLDLAMHRYSLLPFGHVRLSHFPRRTTDLLSSAAA